MIFHRLFPSALKILQKFVIPKDFTMAAETCLWMQARENVHVIMKFVNQVSLSFSSIFSCACHISYTRYLSAFNSIIIILMVSLTIYIIIMLLLLLLLLQLLLSLFTYLANSRHDSRYSESRAVTFQKICYLLD